jgi:hypothetical protein
VVGSNDFYIKDWLLGPAGASRSESPEQANLRYSALMSLVRMRVKSTDFHKNFMRQLAESTYDKRPKEGSERWILRCMQGDEKGADSTQVRERLRMWTGSEEIPVPEKEAVGQGTKPTT